MIDSMILCGAFFPPGEEKNISTDKRNVETLCPEKETKMEIRQLGCCKRPCICE